MKEAGLVEFHPGIANGRSKSKCENCQCHKTPWYLHRNVVIIICSVLTVSICVSVLTAYRNRLCEPKFVFLHEDPSTTKTGTDNVPSGELKIISRREWLAQPPVKQGNPLQHPVPNVVILHTGTENCSTHAACTFFVRRTQIFHIENNGWWDIGYSFLVGGDGSVYVGRGWDTEGAFAFGFNNRSIGIAFIGSFTESLPPLKQILAGQLLIAQGVEQGKLSPDYKLFAHRQLSATESPGLAFFENIKTWSHWSQKT